MRAKESLQLLQSDLSAKALLVVTVAVTWLLDVDAIGYCMMHADKTRNIIVRSHTIYCIFSLLSSLAAFFVPLLRLMVYRTLRDGMLNVLRVTNVYEVLSITRVTKC